MPWLTAIYASHFVSGARALGVDVPLPLALLALGRAPTIDDRIDAAELMALVEDALHRTGRRDLGVVAARNIEEHDSPVYHLVAASQTAGDGLRELVRFSPMLGDCFCYQLRAVDDEVWLSIELTRSSPVRPGLDVLLEFELCAFAMGCLQLFGQEAAGWSEAWLRAADAPTDALTEVARCPARRGMPTTLTRFPARALTLPPIHPDANLAAFLRKNLERRLAALPVVEPTVAARVRDHLYRAVRLDPRAPTCARALGMSNRSLSRRLAEEGTRFSVLLDEVRLDLALAWLDSRPLHEVSDRLGYSEESAFRRAFRRWTGGPPSAARAR